ncbi:MAG: hypothetical protein SFX19_07300 [Alphaproteobacteria bacterium]|nr:hypothetical protein [Alphaproteobacteria bacterium]
MKAIVPLLVALVILLVAMGFYYVSGEKKRAVQVSLQNFSDAVATKDRARVSEALTALLTDDAKIHLTVHFFSIGNTRPAMDENFDKAGFITFVDNILYSLTDYSTTPSLESLDSDTGAVRFTSAEWADGANMMGGVSVNMRYSSSTECTGSAVFENDTARLSQADCQLQFRQVPKPGQEGKFLNQKGLLGLLGGG